MAINWLFFIATLVVGLAILLPTLISLRADNLVDWKWGVVFIPMFLIDAFMFLLIARLTIMLPSNGHKDTRDADSNRTHDDESHAEPKTGLGVIYKLAIMTYISLFILFQIFITLELDRSIAWMWATVFIPYYALEVANFFLTTVAVVTSIQLGKTEYMAEGAQTTSTTESYSASEILLLVINGYSSWLFRIAQMVVFILKLDGVIVSTWAVVFIPFIAEGVLTLASLIYEYIKTKRIINATPGLDIQSTVVFRTFSYLVLASLFYLGLGLFISRLDHATGYPTTAVILIPVFVVLSIVFCCVCCCLPCLVSGARSAVEREMMGEVVNGINLHQIVPVDHRIQ